MWAAEGRNAASLQAFFDGLSDEQKASIKAVSIDMSAGYERAIRDPDHGLPDAHVVFDPFHVVQLGGKAVDQVRRDEYNRHGRSGTETGKWIKGTRYSLLKGAIDLTPRIRIPLRRRAHRHDLPLLRRDPNRAPSPMSHPQTERRAGNVPPLLLLSDSSGPCDRDIAAWLLRRHGGGAAWTPRPIEATIRLTGVGQSKLTTDPSTDRCSVAWGDEEQHHSSAGLEV